jgi:hypothetical protein
MRLCPFGTSVTKTKKKKKNSVDLVRKRTTPTERPQLFGEVSANFGDRGCRVVNVMDPLRPYSLISRLKPLFSLSSSPSIVLTRLSGSRFRLTTSQKFW